MPLHEGLKLEFQRVVETYKNALQKLDELSLANKSNPKSVAKGPAPVSSSHQRQLSLRSVNNLIFYAIDLIWEKILSAVI